MLRLRTARRDDLQLLRALLFEAVFWRPNVLRPPLEPALADPELERYVERFGRPGDFGIVAEEGGEPLGAAWWRYFQAVAPGYGFVDESTPEVSAAVLPAHRGRGIGTALLRALEHEAREQGIKRLSLSVERDNPAAALYERLGFRPLGCEGNALTMVIEPDQPQSPRDPPSTSCRRPRRSPPSWR
jgi:GNAT superfamily N-acetyltransferase